MTEESAGRNYGRLCQLLRAVSIRHQSLALLEFLILLTSAVLLLLLGSIAVPGLAIGLPFVPAAYAFGVVVALAFLLWRGLRVIWPRPIPLSAAHGIEKKFPFLRDDITNSILLFDQTRVRTLKEVK